MNKGKEAARKRKEAYEASPAFKKDQQDEAARVKREQKIRSKIVKCWLKFPKGCSPWYGSYFRNKILRQDGWVLANMFSTEVKNAALVGSD